MPCLHPLGHTSLGSCGGGLDRPVFCAATGISDAVRRAVRILPLSKWPMFAEEEGPCWLAVMGHKKDVHPCKVMCTLTVTLFPGSRPFEKLLISFVCTLVLAEPLGADQQPQVHFAQFIVKFTPPYGAIPRTTTRTQFPS